jgi:lauroyl/myristoyl acyltransferase
VFTTPDGWRIRIEPAIAVERTDDLRSDVATMTKLLATCFERYVSAAPADWHMFQPAWDAPAEVREHVGAPVLR